MTEIQPNLPAAPARPTTANHIRTGQWAELPDVVEKPSSWAWHLVEGVLVEFRPHRVRVLAETLPGGCFDMPLDFELVVSDTDPSGISVRTPVPTRDEFGLAVAAAVALMARCRRRKVGAVLIGTDHLIISTGYNGAPSGLPDCLQGACPRGLTSFGSVEARTPYDDPVSPGYCTALHAEHNAVVLAGRAARGATCYTTDAPCPGCVKTLAGAGAARVVWPGGEGVPAQMLLARKTCEDRPR